MLIINCYKIMVVCVVYSCLIVSWCLAVQTAIAYDRIWILSYNLYAVSSLCGVHKETVRGCVLLYVLVLLGFVNHLLH